jgi:hypothetical protein
VLKLARGIFEIELEKIGSISNIKAQYLFLVARKRS